MLVRWDPWPQPNLDGLEGVATARARRSIRPCARPMPRPVAPAPRECDRGRHLLRAPGRRRVRGSARCLKCVESGISCAGFISGLSASDAPRVWPSRMQAWANAWVTPGPSLLHFRTPGFEGRQPRSGPCGRPAKPSPGKLPEPERRSRTATAPRWTRHPHHPVGSAGDDVGIRAERPSQRVNVTCVTPLGEDVASTLYSFSRPSSPSQRRTPRPSRIGTTTTCK